jgi:SAM-dependent methyltransferase
VAVGSCESPHLLPVDEHRGTTNSCEGGDEHSNSPAHFDHDDPIVTGVFNINAPAVDSGGSSYDGDSAIDNLSLASTTVSTRVYDYRVLYGRRYHALHSDAVYHLPNDDAEIDRLDLQHHLFRMTLDGALYKSPLPSDVHHVLDVGTGSGIWALEFALENPSAIVTGTDLSPVQPSHAPSNCLFYVEDVEQDWNFDNDFDFIHSRMLVVALKDWPNFFQQAFAHLKPGGWLEMQDLVSPMPRCDDGTSKPDSALMVWGESMRTASRRIGIDLYAADRFTNQMRNAGFVDIHVQTEIWPLGTWVKDEKLKERGRWAAENLIKGLEGFSMSFFTRVLGWSEERVRTLVEQATGEIKDRKKHTYMPVVFIWGRKPVST